MKRKKTPHVLCLQMLHITNYIMGESYKNGAPSNEVRGKVLEKVKKIESIYKSYVDNIYKLHNIDRWNGGKASLDLWFNAYHTNKEYMNI